MSGDKTQVFDVFYLDMWADGEGGWEENERHFLCGRQIRTLDTTDRRRVYAEDYYGSGEWWEVGSVKEWRPIYGLQLKEAA